MARTVYYLAISLNGYLAEADGTLDWLTRYQGPAEAMRLQGTEAFPSGMVELRYEIARD